MHENEAGLYWKHGWILLKVGVQVSTCIGYGIIENENRVTGKSKMQKMGMFGQQGDTYAVVGRPSNLFF